MVFDYSGVIEKDVEHVLPVLHSFDDQTSVLDWITHAHISVLQDQKAPQSAGPIEECEPKQLRQCVRPIY